MQMTTALPILALVLSGCAPALPQIETPNQGCNVRGGLAVPEGSAAAGFGGATVAAAEASASVVGDCPEDFYVFERTPAGGWVYYGDPELLKWYLLNAPVTMSRSEYEALRAGAGAP